MLEQFVIYKQPRDFPIGFVVRRWVITGGRAPAPREAWRAESLELAREIVPFGMVQIPRFEDDDPTIVEVWT